MRILYIPLDERPCNYDYPQYIARLLPQLELVVPPVTLLGCKKEAADVDRLWQWFVESVPQCDCTIVSLEMLVYGGLLPSRLHQLNGDSIGERLQRLRTVAADHPAIRMLASTLIMRAPAYSSSDEEPDYYETFGAQLFRWGWLKDLDRRRVLAGAKLTDEDQKELDGLTTEIPSQYLDDYRSRRQKNLRMNVAAIDLVADGVVDFLAIPQDDCAEYGFTASDRERVCGRIEQLGLSDRIHVYPGADEVGCSLLARAVSQELSRSVKIYPLFSSEAGAQLVPLYEDRPIVESTRLHVRAVGAEVVDSVDEADVVVAVNVPVECSAEAKEQRMREGGLSESLATFIDRIQQLLEMGKPLAVADLAFVNGGDTQLIERMDEVGGWDRVLAYGGWNTCCNSLGSTLSTAVVGVNCPNQQAIAFNVMHRLIEDWAYQSIVRWEMVDLVLEGMGATYFDLKVQEMEITAEIGCRMEALWKATMRRSFRKWTIERLEISAPWQRMFEIGLLLEIEPKSSSPTAYRDPQ